MTQKINDDEMVKLGAALRNTIREGAVKVGWTEVEADKMGEIALKPFVSVLQQGGTSKVALSAAIFITDRFGAGMRMEEALKAGQSAEDAFSDFMKMKLKSDPSPEGQAMADAAKGAFDGALKDGRDYQEALSFAFLAARKLNEAARA